MTTTVNIDINRLRIAVHGVSAQLIEEALQGLDSELGRRLGVYGIGAGGNWAPASISELALSPVHLDTTMDVAGLRGLIADRLLDAIAAQTEASAGVADGGDW